VYEDEVEAEMDAGLRRRLYMIHGCWIAATAGGVLPPPPTDPRNFNYNNLKVPP
jgi:hypothetical protein